jgi:pentatricopeptide repeat protein
VIVSLIKAFFSMSSFRLVALLLLVGKTAAFFLTPTAGVSSQGVQPRMAAAPAAGGSPQRKCSTPSNPAARAIVTKLAQLQRSRSAPIDTEGLGRVVRSNDGLNNANVLKQVLLSLKATGEWRLGLALAAMVEAAAPEQQAPAAWDLEGQAQMFLDTGLTTLPGLDENTKDKDEAEDEDEDEDDAEFRRLVASSPNFSGARVDAQGEAAIASPGDATLAVVDTQHYNVLIAMCAEARRWREALALLARMRERTVPRDTVTYNSVLHALDKGGRCASPRPLWCMPLSCVEEKSPRRLLPAHPCSS